MNLLIPRRFGSSTDTERPAKNTRRDCAGKKRIDIPSSDLLLDRHVRIHPQFHRIRGCSHNGQRRRCSGRQHIVAGSSSVAESQHFCVQRYGRWWVYERMGGDTRYTMDQPRCCFCFFSPACALCVSLSWLRYHFF